MKTDIHFWILLGMGNIPGNSCRENQNTHFVWNNPPLPQNHAVYEITRKNVVEPDRPQDSILRYMQIACWIPKATDTHSEYVIRIAFPLQQWLRERASVVGCTYIVSLSAQTNFRLVNKTTFGGRQRWGTLHCAEKASRQVQYVRSSTS